MALSAAMVRSQLKRIKSVMANLSVDANRKGQSLAGELMELRHRKEVMVKNHAFSCFEGAWVMPKEERRQGVILYLHGGGYVYGDLKYAKGFASTLAVQCGMRVLCIGYRLAPEDPFPAALEDALESYKYLLDKGYAPEQIALCGESAGGGLCYSLCLKLKELGLSQPGGIIAISPWVDLTASGPSYAENAAVDPSLTMELVKFFAKQYAVDFEDPYVSPLFGDLSQLPPSIIFAAKEEILLSDSVSLRDKLLAQGCKCKLFVKPERWHAYVVYDLEEDEEDFRLINHFLNKHIASAKMLRWLRLDNAAKIYPAARSKSWSNVFRVSVTLKDEINPLIMKSALDVTLRRFPSISARLRKGLFWYYLEQLKDAPPISIEHSYPLIGMNKKQVRKCALRVIVYKNRLALELFHALTDGTGAMIFLKSLTAEYLQQAYGVHIPAEQGVLGRLEYPSSEELEDSFQKYAGPVAASRKENDAFHLPGTKCADGFLHLTCFKVNAKEALDRAHSYGVSLTVFLTAALMQAMQQLQSAQGGNPKRRKAIKILIPVNLRNLFPSKSVRNFALYTTPEIDPKQGEYSFEEICKVIHHWIGVDVTPKKMAAKIATNVNSERLLAVRLLPLFIKNPIMKLIYHLTGERKSCFCMSNLGNVKLPEEMMPYVERFDFILGPQATTPNNCGVLSFGDTLYINFIRSIEEPFLEQAFFRVLQEQGLQACVESNRKE